MWFDILKIRKPGPEAREGARLRDKFESSLKPEPEFSFKKSYTYDELYNLIDPDIKNKLERFMKKGQNLLTQEYRLFVMGSKREKREFAQSGKMPSPFTMDDIKDRISIKLKDDPIGDQTPTYDYFNEKIMIVLPITKRPIDDDSQTALGNSLDELYKDFTKDHKQKKQTKWYQEYRRGSNKRESARFTPSILDAQTFERPDFDADDWDIKLYKEYIMNAVFTNLSETQIRSGADPLSDRFR